MVLKNKSCNFAAFPLATPSHPRYSTSMSTVNEQAATYQSAKVSGQALYAWRRSIGLNRETFARLANFSERSLATYEKHKEFPMTIRPQINEAVRLVTALLEIIPADQLADWLHSANPGFGDRKPWTLIEKGERDLLWQMIYQTRQGAFA